MRFLLLLSLALSLLAGCSREEDVPVVRPGTQALDKLAAVKPPTSAIAQPRTAVAADVCAQMLRVSEQGQLILDRSDPARLVVSEALWPRVPSQVQRTIVDCVRSARPPGVRWVPMKVVHSTG
jgi:hypothetical protein